MLDRKTGKFIAGKAYARQTWAKGLDSTGRPILIPGKEPTEKAISYIQVCRAPPIGSVLHTVLAPAFSMFPLEKLARYILKEVTYKPGDYFMGGGEQMLPGDNAWGAVRALDPATGNIKWEFKLQSPPWCGVLSTAGGLIFSGTTEGNFFALDAETGKSKWQFQTVGAFMQTR